MSNFEFTQSISSNSNQILLDWINTLNSSRCLLASSTEDLYDGEIIYEVFKIVYSLYLKYDNIYSQKDAESNRYNCSHYNWEDFNSSEEFYTYIMSLINQMNICAFNCDDLLSESQRISKSSFIPKSDNDIYSIISSLKKLYYFFNDVLSAYSNQIIDLETEFEGRKENSKVIENKVFNRKGISFKVDTSLEDKKYEALLNFNLGKRVALKLGTYSNYSQFEVFGFNLSTKPIVDIGFSGKKLTTLKHYVSFSNSNVINTENKPFNKVNSSQYINTTTSSVVNQIAVETENNYDDLDEPLPSYLNQVNECKFLIYKLID